MFIETIHPEVVSCSSCGCEYIWEDEGSSLSYSRSGASEDLYICGCCGKEEVRIPRHEEE